MTHSSLDLFKIGIGPSSSHTVGPMNAVRTCLFGLDNQSLESINRLKIDLYGSLALTGRGHSSDIAVVLGILGASPETVEVGNVAAIVENVKASRALSVLGKHPIRFNFDNDIVFNKKVQLPEHPNGIRISGYDAKEGLVFSETYFSIGGGFVKTQAEMSVDFETAEDLEPYPFDSAKALLSHCKEKGWTIARVVLENEKKIQTQAIVDERIQQIWTTMKACVEKGLNTEGVLPGGLNVKRRAAQLYQRILGQFDADPTMVLDWISVFALAVNEENAAGGRVVTAPTNGASGIIPAILHYYERFHQPLNKQLLRDFFLTAGAVGGLYKRNASISGAEMGCQGEVGVASSMAAAGLTSLQGGSPEQIECAAEIAMEHHLGMTCDPVKGLVQIPCIERNTMGAIKAVNASKLAIHGDGKQTVSLDKVIRTMKQTGDDMKSRYKETSMGGLAINVIEC
ncbi:MAG: L-serine dehydratase [Candidatus Marinamargulisbacteria bacterium]|jgi:L-serine dehydratase